MFMWDAIQASQLLRKNCWMQVMKMLRSHKVEEGSVKDSPLTMYRLDTTNMAVIEFEVWGRQGSRVIFNRMGELLAVIPDFDFYESLRDAQSALIPFVRKAKERSLTILASRSSEVARLSAIEKELLNAGDEDE